MQEPKEDQRSGPLSDLKVLDLAGPIGVYCAKLMADLGADVVRIEPPKGDSMREIGPFFDDDPNPEKSLYWWHFNTSKRGVTLDLEQPEGQEIFRRLVKWADIGVESFPPPDISIAWVLISIVCTQSTRSSSSRQSLPLAKPGRIADSTGQISLVRL